MRSPPTDDGTVTEEFAAELDERASDVLEDDEFVTFDEHEQQRD